MQWSDGVQIRWQMRSIRSSDSFRVGRKLLSYKSGLAWQLPVGLVT